MIQDLRPGILDQEKEKGFLGSCHFLFQKEEIDIANIDIKHMAFFFNLIKIQG